MRKGDQWIKSDYSNACHASNHDSACRDHDCLWGNTCIINTYIYQWTYRIMSDHGNISYIYIFSCSYCMRRNNYRDMDSNGCMWKSACTCNKNDYSNTCCTANHDSACRDHNCLWGNTCIINTYLYQWTYRIMSDHGNISDIYILSCSYCMRRNDHGDMDSNGCMWKNACTCNKNNYSNACCTANHDSACRNHNCLWGNTSINNTYLYQWTYRIMSDHRNISYIYIFSCSYCMRRNNHRDMDSNGCMWKSTCTCNKNDYSNTCHASNHDSACRDYDCLWGNTSIINTYLY